MAMFWHDCLCAQCCRGKVALLPFIGENLPCCPVFWESIKGKIALLPCFRIFFPVPMSFKKYMVG